MMWAVSRLAKQRSRWRQGSPIGGQQISCLSCGQSLTEVAQKVMDPEQEHSAARQNSLEHRVCFGPYQADFHTQEFWKHGIRIKLSGQPLQVLEMLLARPGELVTRAELQKNCGLMVPSPTSITASTRQ